MSKVERIPQMFSHHKIWLFEINNLKRHSSFMSPNGAKYGYLAICILFYFSKSGNLKSHKTLYFHSSSSSS